MRSKTANFILLTILLIGGFFRVYFLNFGLPHSFYADEPEFIEPAIKYTYEMRNIIKNNDYYKLIPISFVYGTVPTYSLTVALMGFSKLMNISHINFDKTTIFIFFRALFALVSFGIIIATWKLTQRMTSNTTTQLAVLAIVALNWKFIVHAHYANADIILTLLLVTSFYLFYNYLQKPDNRNLFLSAFIFGLATGTKITALISLPIYLAFCIKKKDIYALPGFVLSAAIAFLITNPFSLVYFGDFSFRIFEMLTKEGGMVFDSVDTNPYKYLYALANMCTWEIIIFSIAGFCTKIFTKKTAYDSNEFDAFLILNLLVYVVFFSIQTRRVDRWLLPILPIIFIYAGFGLTYLLDFFNKKLMKSVLAIFIFGIYLINPVLLLTQFQRWTPKSEAYIWAKANLPELKTKLVYTEEGLDPLNKVPQTTVAQFNVYVSEGAQLFMPQNPLLYDYVIISSRPMQNFKRSEVKAAYPSYAEAWDKFEQTLNDPKKFSVEKTFTRTHPELIPLSNVTIYKKL